VHFDELYAYDGLYQLRDLQRGELNGTQTAIVTGTLTFHETWSLDSTGNWQGYTQDATGAGTPTLSQSRTANRVNEITEIADSVGPGWVVPQYDAAGNMTRLPQPNNPSAGYAATWDAWNRLVKLADGDTTVAQYAYDPATRRVVAATSSEQRHFYYSANWQILEERLGDTPAAASADRQFVWGLRYIDDCVLRDRTTTAGPLAERLYALQDANWNVTAIVDPVAAVQERYAYSAYGVVHFLDAGFNPIAASDFDWEALYCGYQYDAAVALYQVRYRWLNPPLGNWISRDPARRGRKAYRYCMNAPIACVDPAGLVGLRLPYGYEVKDAGGKRCGHVSVSLAQHSAPNVAGKLVDLSGIQFTFDASPSYKDNGSCCCGCGGEENFGWIQHRISLAQAVPGKFHFEYDNQPTGPSDPTLATQPIGMPAKVKPYEAWSSPWFGTAYQWGPGSVVITVKNDQPVQGPAPGPWYNHGSLTFPPGANDQAAANAWDWNASPQPQTTIWDPAENPSTYVTQLVCAGKGLAGTGTSAGKVLVTVVWEIPENVKEGESRFLVDSVSAGALSKAAADEILK
jgi:RHS repeat-associated protein